LYLSLMTQREYYDANRQCQSALYTDHVIYSPDVPVIRDDSGELLEAPYSADFITAPAVNRGALANRERADTALIEQTMAARMAKLLAIAVVHDVHTLILGAWGCGVFQNDPETVARLFHESLHGAFQSAFPRVIFAIYARGSERHTLGAFERRFAAQPAR